MWHSHTVLHYRERGIATYPLHGVTAADKQASS